VYGGGAPWTYGADPSHEQKIAAAQAAMSSFFGVLARQWMTTASGGGSGCLAPGDGLAANGCRAGRLSRGSRFVVEGESPRAPLHLPDTSTELSGPALLLPATSTELSRAAPLLPDTSTELSGPALLLPGSSTELSGPALLLPDTSTELSGPALLLLRHLHGAQRSSTSFAGHLPGAQRSSTSFVSQLHGALRRAVNINLNPGMV